MEPLTLTAGSWARASALRSAKLVTAGGGGTVAVTEEAELLDTGVDDVGFAGAAAAAGTEGAAGGGRGGARMGITGSAVGNTGSGDVAAAGDGVGPGAFGGGVAALSAVVDGVPVTT